MLIIDNPQDIHLLPKLQYREFTNALVDDYFEQFNHQANTIIEIFSNQTGVDLSRTLKLNDLFMHTERLIRNDITEPQLVSVIKAITYLNFKHALFLFILLFNRLNYMVILAILDENWLRENIEEQQNTQNFFNSLRTFLKFNSLGYVINGTGVK